MKIPKWPNRLLSVDPGFNTGWAYWEGTDTPKTGHIVAIEKVTNVALRLRDLAEQFSAVLGKYHPQRIIIEDQWFSEYNMTSLASAKTGAMKKLTWLTGAYLVVCFDVGVTPELVLPVKWKGQMDDLAVKKRVELVTGIKYKNPHIADAVGIGLNSVDRFITVI